MTKGDVLMMQVDADIFASTYEALVNPVDAATGAQGKGLAKTFVDRYPIACSAYRRFARRGEMVAGSVWAFECSARWILFAATKAHWREKSRLEYIATAATNIRHEVIELGVRSVALPALGCGEGGLDWGGVRPLLVDAAERMAEVGVHVEIYPPHEAPTRKR